MQKISSPSIYGHFNCVTSCVKVLGWLEKKKKKHKKDEHGF